jgi:pimeloyl-ACP methyl ester carboxylesterase
MHRREVEETMPGSVAASDLLPRGEIDQCRVRRRGFLGGAAAGIVASELPVLASAFGAEGAASLPPRPRSLGPVQQVKAGALDVGYVEMGPSDGPPVLLLHGWPYDIHSYVDVAPMLAARGCRVVIPHLRGHGTTRILGEEAPRSGQQAALGVDVIDLLDALGISRAVLAGYDWGGRAACVAAALWPQRCTGLVSVNSYLIQNIATAGVPLAAMIEAGFWYQFYFLTERGRAGLTANRQDIARVMWSRNSPTWRFDDDTFARSALAFDNPDYVDVVIHSYRHRLGHAPGFPQYEAIEKRLALQPVITVPSITLDGDADGVVAATDGRSSASKFAGTRQHRVIPNAGHNLPQEAPLAFTDAVWELATKSR